MSRLIRLAGTLILALAARIHGQTGPEALAADAEKASAHYHMALAQPEGKTFPPSPYSYRSAISGSTLAARRAGM